MHSFFQHLLKPAVTAGCNFVSYIHTALFWQSRQETMIHTSWGASAEMPEFSVLQGLSGGLDKIRSLESGIVM